MRRAIFAAAALSACGVAPGPFTLSPVARDLDAPLYLTSPPNDGRLFIVEQTGAIRIVKAGELLPEPFLDLSAKISCCGERGLLSLAFHPDFAQNGRFFVDYTDAGGTSVISELLVSPEPDRADAASERVLLTVAQPFENHNGGLLKFGPDGFLYIALGDGGSAGDPLLAGQDLTTLLGKLLRIDVDAGDPFAIPAGNPFANQAGARGEIWHFGLRNPWRFSFDRQTGELYIGDVGQNNLEEIDLAPAGAGGINWGWSALEGTECFNDPNCQAVGAALPITEYSHRDGCSVTGGYVYRGAAVPALFGKYLYSDFCTGFLRALTVEGGQLVSDVDITRDFGVRRAGDIASFGEDAAGELYVVDRGGTVFKIIQTP
jgi:glucose/arabinose dehydrogenase